MYQPYAAIYGHRRSYPAIYGHIRPYMAIYGHIRPYTAIYGHIRLSGGGRTHFGTYFATKNGRLGASTPTTRHPKRPLPNTPKYVYLRL